MKGLWRQYLTMFWREWLPTPVFLPGKFPGQRSLMGYSPWGHKESNMTEQLIYTHTHTLTHTLLIQKVLIWLVSCLIMSIFSVVSLLTSLKFRIRNRYMREFLGGICPHQWTRGKGSSREWLLPLSESPGWAAPWDSGRLSKGSRVIRNCAFPWHSHHCSIWS